LAGEECDDDNGTNNDACANNCLLNICGNGRNDWVNDPNGTPTVETCDDGDPNNPGPFADTAGCNGTGATDPNGVSLECTVQSCGDGYHNQDPNSGEECDDGNGVGNDLCNDASCNLNLCGDGNIDWQYDPNGGPLVLEFCDPNTVNSGLDPRFALSGSLTGVPGDTTACTAACTPHACGDGLADPTVDPNNPEQCDGGACCVGGTSPACGDPTGLCNPATGTLVFAAPATCGVAYGGACVWLGAAIGCDDNCRSNQCGNGQQDTAEDCDPGPGQVDAVDPNGDPAVCVDTIQGIFDGFPCTIDADCLLGSCNIDHTTEALVSTALCNADCTDSECGDGFENDQDGEQCDDGCLANIPNTCEDPHDNGDGCSYTCQDEVCGDGIVQIPLGEECDPADPNGVPLGETAACNGPGAFDSTDPNVSVECQDTECGDGYKNQDPNSVEECDDGNVASNDGCRSDCIDESCGDGITQTSEECDDGKQCNDPNGVLISCTSDPSGCAAPASCATIDGDDCSADCDSNEECGNLVIDQSFPDPNLNEDCDDGNLVNNDGCSEFCVDETCGNGIQGDQECDDGNDVNDDGCTNNCELDPDQDGKTGASDPCNAPGQATGKLDLKKLDEANRHRIDASGSFVPASGVDPTNTGIHLELSGSTTGLLYEAYMVGNEEAPGGEYWRKSSNPACGALTKRDGWTARVRSNGSVLYQYVNKTTVAPDCSDTDDGTCTGDAEGITKVQLQDRGDGTWKFKVKIKDTNLDALPLTSGADVLEDLQLELSLGDTCTTDPSAEGAAGQCADLNFKAGCKAVEKFDALQKVKCKK
jgi:cysteine-rich repeat protein